MRKAFAVHFDADWHFHVWCIAYIFDVRSRFVISKHFRPHFRLRAVDRFAKSNQRMRTNITRVSTQIL